MYCMWKSEKKTLCEQESNAKTDLQKKVRLKIGVYWIISVYVHFVITLTCIGCVIHTNLCS